MEKETLKSKSDIAKEKTEIFLKKLTSDMHYKAKFSGNTMDFEWLDIIENACPYLDNTVRKPKLVLINEETVELIEKAKKITVASVKDLSRHTNYIEKIDKNNGDVKPSKILDIHSEETFNIYENRFIFTLMKNLARFLDKKKKELEELELINTRNLEYAANTKVGGEEVEIIVKVSASEDQSGNSGSSVAKQIENAKYRLGRIGDYMRSWQRSEMIKALEKAHVPLVNSPIKKTNIILKNPNFQIAVKLWTYLQSYNLNSDDNGQDNIDSDGDKIMRGLLDHAALVDYYVLDAIAKTKKETKSNLAEYAILLLNDEIQRIVGILINCGIDISDEEILAMIASGLKNERQNRLVGSNDVKKKFKNAMDEYLEKTQDYL